MFWKKKTVVEMFEESIRTTPEFSSLALCSEGSLTVLFAFLLFIGLCAVRTVLHRQAMRLNRNFTHRIQTTDEDKFVHTFNQIFVAPFISDSMESFIAIIFFAWFVMTIPMGITRYYSKLWMNELIAQQGPFNVLAYLIGCKSLEFDTMQYTTEIQHDPNVVPERGSPEELDWVFLYHLLFGICWLTSGFMQIFWARSGWSTNKLVQFKSHKAFGKFVAIPSLLLHLFFASRIAIRNPANQVLVIRVQYFAMIVDSLLLCYTGLKYMQDSRKMKPGSKEQESLRNRHKVQMVFCYFQSVFGSGPIRITGWFLWIVGKFFRPELQIRIDRGECQKLGSPLGSAENCWVPVFLNLLLTNVLLVWLEWLFLSLPYHQIEKHPHDVKAIKSSIKGAIGFSAVILPLLFFPAVDRLILYPIGIVMGIIRMHSWHIMLHDPTTFVGRNYNKYKGKQD